jgi:hypothetical protein
VTTERRRLTIAFSMATLGLIVALGTGPIATRTIVSAYVLVLAAILLVSLTRIAAAPAARTNGSMLDEALRPRYTSIVRPPELVRVEREITLGRASASHLHVRLLPLLREAAAARLGAHHNVELDRRPETARRLLGDEAWELLRPDRPEPADRNAPGISLGRLRRLIDGLERL